MKKSFVILLTLIFSLVLSGNVVLAKTEVDYKSVKIGKKLTLEVFDDGRIAAISNPSSLSEHELDLILQKIGYSQSSINNFTLDFKRNLVSIGGKVAEGKIENVTQKYIRDGESIEITPTNYYEVREKQKQDLLRFPMAHTQKEELILPKIQSTTGTCSGSNGICQDGKFSGEIYAVKIGETSTQLQYMVIQTFKWLPPPFLAPNDLAGVHWAPYGQPISGSAYAEGAWKYAGQFHYQGFPMDLSSNHGFGADIQYDNRYVGATEYNGYLQEAINISNSNRNHQLTISGLYAHPWGPNNWSLSIGAGAISISGDLGLGSQWDWRYNFTAK